MTFMGWYIAVMYKDIKAKYLQVEEVTTHVCRWYSAVARDVRPSHSWNSENVS